MENVKICNFSENESKRLTFKISTNHEFLIRHVKPHVRREGVENEMARGDDPRFDIEEMFLAMLVYPRIRRVPDAA